MHGLFREKQPRHFLPWQVPWGLEKLYLKNCQAQTWVACVLTWSNKKRLPRLLVGFIGDIYYPSMWGWFRKPWQIANIPMKQPGWLMESFRNLFLFRGSHHTPPYGGWKIYGPWKINHRYPNMAIFKRSHHFKNHTLPETNVAPENRPSQKETDSPTIHFQGLLLLVSGRVILGGCHVSFSGKNVDFDGRTPRSWLICPAAGGIPDLGGRGELFLSWRVYTL